MRSGLYAQVGLALEETFGTFKTPTRFLPFGAETLEEKPAYQKGTGIRAGRLVQAENLHRRAGRTVSGNITGVEFVDQGMGLLFNLLHGNVVTPAKIESGEEKAYKQVHEIGTSDPFGKSATIQVGRPGTGGEVHPFSYLGSKFLSVKVTLEADGFAMIELEVDGQQEDTDEELAEATYDSDAIPFNFEDMAVEFGGENAANVRSITLNIPVPQNTERKHLGNSGLKDEPIANAKMEITGEMTLEFQTMADHTRFKNETVTSVALKGEGNAIEEGQNFEANLSLSAGKQVASAPQVSGEDIVTSDVTFEAVDNGSEVPMTVELISTDSAL